MKSVQKCRATLRLFYNRVRDWQFAENQVQVESNQYSGNLKIPYIYNNCISPCKRYGQILHYITITRVVRNKIIVTLTPHNQQGYKALQEAEERDAITDRMNDPGISKAKA